MGLWGWGRYVPVAERRAKARREMDTLRNKGQDIQPVTLDGRTIARSFWGKGWCHHLESFSDYANRLPRGRTYVRNGSVCHLDIRPGRIDAIVSGSELYHVVLRITALQAAPWTAIKNQCAGHIGSMLELLQGTLSDQVLAIVTNRQHGLFPQPGEMTFDCSCPNWAVMCKHVAAVLYGVGSRLDSRPDLLFLLRDVDAQELITAEMALPAASVTSDTLADAQLGAIFGIDLDTATDAPSAPPTPPKKPPRTTRRVVQACRLDHHTATGVCRAGPQHRPSHATGQPRPTSCPHGDAPDPIFPTHTSHDAHVDQGDHQHRAQEASHWPIGGPAAPTTGTVRGPIRRPAWCVIGDRVPLGSHTGTAHPTSRSSERLGRVATTGQAPSNGLASRSLLTRAPTASLPLFLIELIERASRRGCDFTLLAGLQNRVVHRCERHPVPQLGVLLDAVAFSRLHRHHKTSGIHNA